MELILAIVIIIIIGSLISKLINFIRGILKFLYDAKFVIIGLVAIFFIGRCSIHTIADVSRYTHFKYIKNFNKNFDAYEKYCFDIMQRDHNYFENVNSKERVIDYKKITKLKDFQIYENFLSLGENEVEKVRLFKIFEEKNIFGSSYSDFEVYQEYLKNIENPVFNNFVKIAKEEDYDINTNNIFIWDVNNKSYLLKKNYESTILSINKLVQLKIQEFLKNREPLDIKSLIPAKIPKPNLPSKPKLVKSQFETNKMFEQRIEQAIEKRKKEISELQKEYSKKIEKRNRKIEDLKSKYLADVERIKEEFNSKKEVLPKKIIAFTKKAISEVLGKPSIKNIVYDAENQKMIGKVYSDNCSFEESISIDVPLSEAKDFYESIDNAKPVIFFILKNDEIILHSLLINFQDNFYNAELDKSDFIPEKVEYVINDLNLDELQNEEIDLELQAIEPAPKIEMKSIKLNKNLSCNELDDSVQKFEGGHKNDKNWLFVIGIENYDDADCVLFSQNSSELFKEATQKVFGIKDRNTYSLIEEDATSGKIKDKLNLMLDNVKDGDKIYFYYSGHGVPVPQTEESFILPKDKIVDYISKEDDFNLSKIYKKLSDSKASKVFVFVDACFSGKTDNTSIFKGVAPGLTRVKKVQFNEDKMVIMTAGKDNQFSNSFDEKGHRMFTYYLIKSMIERKTSDINLIYKDVSIKVHDSSFEKGDIYIQDPQIYGNTKLEMN